MNSFGAQYPYRYWNRTHEIAIPPASTTADPNSLVELMARGWVLVSDETGEYRLRHRSDLDFPIPAPPRKQPKVPPKRARKSRKASSA